MAKYIASEKQHVKADNKQIRPLNRADGYLMDFRVKKPNEEKVIPYFYIKEARIKFIDGGEQRFTPFNGSKDADRYTLYGFKVRDHCTLYLNPLSSQSEQILELPGETTIEITYFDKDMDDLPFD